MSTPRYVGISWKAPRGANSVSCAFNFPSSTQRLYASPYSNQTHSTFPAKRLLLTQHPTANFLSSWRPNRIFVHARANAFAHQQVDIHWQPREKIWAWFCTVTVIPCFNIFLFAVIFCLFWMEPMPLTLSRKFSAQLKPTFLKFDVLVMTSMNTLPITSMTIYVKPPQNFFMDRTSPTGTLPWNFFIIWKLQHTINCQDLNWGNVLCILFCDGKICWIVIRVWRWMHPIYCDFTFLTQLPRV